MGKGWERIRQRQGINKTFGDQPGLPTYDYQDNGKTERRQITLNSAPVAFDRPLP
ncbi:MAG: hypothetical protein NW237_00685 [Cyanobacteriota bacterium]|nr:hypothetical protein [Cyanobacteriota bacterium]